MAQLADLNTDQSFAAKVLQTERLTPADTEEVREIQLEVQEPDFRCSVDQSFGVLINLNDDFGPRRHHRLYSVADVPSKSNGKQRLTMLVKRCNYVDEFSGELQHGVASNYLCDRQAGDTITITGPHHLPFEVPADTSANIIMIGMGTGIAPFRSFVKHIYHYGPEWTGKIRLFYGARSGLELLYLNDKDGDLTNYYDRDTFEAFSALSPRPAFDDPIDLDKAIEARAAEILEMLQYANTYVYVAGYAKVKEMLDQAFAKIMGSKEKWAVRKAELVAGNKWAEILY
jgi:ferredoxin--NADP+ reductase